MNFMPINQTFPRPVSVPDKVDENNTETYGRGAFIRGLLAVQLFEQKQIYVVATVFTMHQSDITKAKGLIMM
jgi:hypothetical protein